MLALTNFVVERGRERKREGEGERERGDQPNSCLCVLFVVWFADMGVSVHGYWTVTKLWFCRAVSWNA